MKTLVCIKRVPAPGARIILTPDARSIDARHLSFTVSPHEECAVEESVRLKELHGGTVTVMTLGRPEAEEQLRYAISVGADMADLLATDEVDIDPQATAAALTDRIRELEAEWGPFDLILFGNESADSGGYQVGVRVAHALGRPVISGIKGLAVDDHTVEARREIDDGFEIYRLPMPAIVAVKEGINLPRYPTLPGRLRAKKAQVRTVDPVLRAGGLRMLSMSNPAEQQTATKLLGHGSGAAPAVVDFFEELGLL